MDDEFKVNYEFLQPVKLQYWSLINQHWTKGNFSHLKNQNGTQVFSKEGLIVLFPRHKKVKTKNKIGYYNEKFFGIVLSIDEYNLFNGILGVNEDDFLRIIPIFMKN